MIRMKGDGLPKRSETKKRRLQKKRETTAKMGGLPEERRKKCRV